MDFDKAVIAQTQRTQDAHQIAIRALAAHLAVRDGAQYQAEMKRHIMPALTDSNRTEDEKERYREAARLLHYRPEE